MTKHLPQSESGKVYSSTPSRLDPERHVDHEPCQEVQILVLNVESVVRSCERFLPLEGNDATAARAEATLENRAAFETARSEVMFCLRLLRSKKTADGLAVERSLFKDSEILEAGRDLRDTLDQVVCWFDSSERSFEITTRIPAFPADIQARLKERANRFIREAYFPRIARSFGILDELFRDRDDASCTAACGDGDADSTHVSDALAPDSQCLSPKIVGQIVQFASVLGQANGRSAPRIPRRALELLLEAASLIREENQCVTASDSETQDDVMPDAAPANGANGANTSRLFPKGLPEDQQIVDLVVRLDAGKGRGMSWNEIAREFTGETLGRQNRAQSLLTRIRKLRGDGSVLL